MEDWQTLFGSLSTPTGAGERFTVAPVTSLPGAIVGKDSRGRPAFLVRSGRTFVSSVNVRLRNIEVTPNQRCTVTGRDGISAAEDFSVVRCLGDDSSLQLQFLRVVSIVLGDLKAMPSGLDIARALASVAELFHAMTSQGTRTTQGLWAELLLIAAARDPHLALGAWHEDPDDIFDFSSGTQRLEVKSVSRMPRRHHFAFEQLDPPLNSVVVVASTTVTPAGGGDTVAMLVDEIHQRVGDSPQLLSKLHRAVILSIGSDWNQTATLGFDRELAERDLKFYDARVVPHVLPPLPSDVSEVRFVADLTRSRSLSERQLGKLGALASAIGFGRRR